MSRVIKKVNSLKTALYALLALFARLLAIIGTERYSFRALGDCLEEVVDVVIHEEFRGNKLQLEGVVMRLVVAAVANALCIACLYLRFCGFRPLVGLGRGFEDVRQLEFGGQVLRGVAPFWGFEWHHSSCGLGSNPICLVWVVPPILFFLVDVVYPPTRDILCKTV